MASYSTLVNDDSAMGRHRQLGLDTVTRYFGRDLYDALMGARREVSDLRQTAPCNESASGGLCTCVGGGDYLRRHLRNGWAAQGACACSEDVVLDADPHYPWKRFLNCGADAPPRLHKLAGRAEPASGERTSTRLGRAGHRRRLTEVTMPAVGGKRGGKPVPVTVPGAVTAAGLVIPFKSSVPGLAWVRVSWPVSRTSVSAGRAARRRPGGRLGEGGDGAGPRRLAARRRVGGAGVAGRVASPVAARRLVGALHGQVVGDDLFHRSDGLLLRVDDVLDVLRKRVRRVAVGARQRRRVPPLHRHRRRGGHRVGRRVGGGVVRLREPRVRLEPQRVWPLGGVLFEAEEQKVVELAGDVVGDGRVRVVDDAEESGHRRHLEVGRRARDELDDLSVRNERSFIGGERRCAGEDSTAVQPTDQMSDAVVKPLIWMISGAIQ